MVALPSDMITLPLLPRIIPRGPSPIILENHKRHHESGLDTTQKIVIAVVSSVLLLIIILTIVVCAWQRKRRAARLAPKDAMSSSSAGSFGGGFPAAPEQALGPRALDNHLSPGESQMHDVPLSAGPKYGYGAQVDGLRIPGMAAKPLQYGYSQAPVSHFSPA